MAWIAIETDTLEITSICDFINRWNFQHTSWTYPNMTEHWRVRIKTVSVEILCHTLRNGADQNNDGVLQHTIVGELFRIETLIHNVTGQLPVKSMQMFYLEPRHTLPVLSLLESLFNNERCKKRDLLFIGRRKEVDEKHEKCVESNSLPDFRPSRYVDVGIRKADGNV